jgi:hypothetical protein
VQAFAVIRFQVGLMALLVVPGLIAAARFHRRHDANHSRFFPALVQHRLDMLLLTEFLLASNEYDLDVVFGGDTLDILPDGTS